MEISELKSIIEKSGLSAYKIEKDLKIPNGTLAQVLKGTKKLPEKYEEPLRSLGPGAEKIKSAIQIIDERPIEEALLKIEQVPEPEEVKPNMVEQMAEYSQSYEQSVQGLSNLLLKDQKKQVKRPDMSIADLL